MKRHYNLTGEPFIGNLGEAGDEMIITFDKNTTEVANIAFTLRLGNLPPSVMFELWSTLELPDCVDEVQWREALAQHFFDSTNCDISDYKDWLDSDGKIINLED